MFEWKVGVSHVLVCFVLPTLLAMRDRKFLSVWLATWGYMILWYVFMDFIISPMVFGGPIMEYAVPEGPSLGAAIIVGWAPSALIAAFALLLSKVFRAVCPLRFYRILSRNLFQFEARGGRSGDDDAPSPRDLNLRDQSLME